jgi:hypothetical protein
VSSALRVLVHDAWDEVILPWQADATLSTIKQVALETTRTVGAPDAFVLKFNGAELRDESVTLAASGVPENGALILLRRRRRPVR